MTIQRAALFWLHSNWEPTGTERRELGIALMLTFWLCWCHHTLKVSVQRSLEAALVVHLPIDWLVQHSPLLRVDAGTALYGKEFPWRVLDLVLTSSWVSWGKRDPLEPSWSKVAWQRTLWGLMVLLILVRDCVSLRPCMQISTHCPVLERLLCSWAVALPFTPQLSIWFGFFCPGLCPVSQHHQHSFCPVASYTLSSVLLMCMGSLVSCLKFQSLSSGGSSVPSCLKSTGVPYFSVLHVYRTWKLLMNELLF